MQNMISEEQFITFLDSLFTENVYVLDNKKVSSEIITDSILFSIETGGSTGGDCWGGRTASYDVSYDERKKKLFESLKSYYSFDDLFENSQYNSSRYEYEKTLQENFIIAFNDMAEKYYYSDVASKSDYYDYYGNGRDYSIIAIPLKELMEKVLTPNNLITFEEVYPHFKEKSLNSLEKTEKTEKLVLVTQKIKDFELQRDKELVELQNEIKTVQKRLNYLEKSLMTFEEQKNQDLNTLQKQKKQLLSEGITLPLNNKKTY